MRKLQLNELEKLRNNAYDKRNFRKIFEISLKVLLYNSRFHLFSGKLKSKWNDPFVVKNVYPCGAVEIENPIDSVTFKVNSQKLKSYLECQPHKADTEINLSDPPDLN